MKEVIIKSKIVGKEGAIGGGKPIAFPDLSAYALRSDFIRLESSFNDFLEGDDADNVINRWKELEAFLNNISEDYNLLSLLNGKADKATTLSGYGITDAYTKTNVDDLLKAYVTLGGTQKITGEKNFTGSLKVNGSPIYYDTEKKYWKLEGDLLVTGGVTMYGSDSSFTPSTIMDAIAVDGTTISKSGGVLKVIGGTGGGVADSVAWANITGKPTWIGSSKPSYSYSEITGAISTTELQNYLTQNSYINVTSGDNRYLMLSGGTIDSYFGAFSIKRNTSWASAIKFENTSGVLGYIGYNDDYTVQIWDKNQENSKYILHSGNYSNYALPLSGGTIVGNTNPLTLRCQSGTFVQQLFQLGNNTVSGIGKTDTYTFLTNYVNGSLATEIHLHDDGNFTIYSNKVLNTIWHSGNDGSGSGLDADTLDGLHNGELKASTLHSGGGFAVDANTLQFSDYSLRFYSGIPNTSTNLPTSSGYQNGLLALPLHSNESTAQFYLSVGKSLFYRSHQTYDWNQIAYITDNVASATKLQTARTIWGQNFDGTGNVSGTVKTMSGHGLHIAVTDDTYWQSKGIISTSWESGLEDYTDILVPSSVANTAKIRLLKNGNVGIGTPNPKDKLDVDGNIIATEYYAPTPSGGKYPKFRLISDQNSDSTWLQSANAAGTSANGIITLSGMYGNGLSLCKILGPLLVTHGITMYSDQRKKTILNHVELSLKQIAEAPLIEHYYNSDEKKTTHVGSIAQYWANMNDWFCKMDSEGYYTMEIQNAALASAISIARELDRYETKTDKDIKKLKKRICELEEEVELLKAS